MSDPNYRIDLEAMVDPRAITYQELLDLWTLAEARKPVVYYGATTAVPRATVYEISATLLADDEPFLVLHPDDLAPLRQMYPGVRFVPLSEKPPPTRAQLVEALTKQAIRLARA